MLPILVSINYSGTKCPELVVNFKQFSLLTRKKNLSHIQAVPSNIINYKSL